ncbi:hypothetical protein DFQ29_007983 [Apophysomyces sp. BC1021]|nr:hypothetical protein DFQ29_007983 [Apophysomyces sp. BC1021]
MTLQPLPKKRHIGHSFHGDASSSGSVLDDDKSSMIPEEVDVKDLADSLRALNDDELRELYFIISQYDTRSIIETEAEIIFDIYALAPSLLIRLWEYTRDVKHRHKIERQ